MNSYPQFAEIKGKRYKINTDFKAALKCNEVAEDMTIQDSERALAVIYLLFGEEGLKSEEDWEDLLKIASKYLKCGQDKENDNEEEVNIDFSQDWSYIQASFFSDYNVNLSKTEMHWWQFYELLCGLTEKCILNRIRFIRDFDISQIKDGEEREKWIKQKERVALNKEMQKTAEEKRLDELFEKQMRGG